MTIPDYKLIFKLFGLSLMFVGAPGLVFASDQFQRLDLELNYGSRVDQLDWNISGDLFGENPNVLSMLSWKELEIAEIIAKGRIVLFNNRFPFGGVIRANLNYGEIQSGLNQDSDYGLDNRLNEWSRSNNKADKGEVWDFVLGGGVVFKALKGKLLISPLIGFSQHSQDLAMHDGYQTVSLDNPFSSDPNKNPPAVGPIHGLDSSYDTEWRSGWLGLDLQLQSSSSFDLHGFVEFHSAVFRADADWNLRPDFKHPKSFSHYSDDAMGLVAGFGARFGLKHILFNLGLQYQRWQATDGLDTVFFSDGSLGYTRVNDVNWESLCLSTGLTARF